MDISYSNNESSLRGRSLKKNDFTISSRQKPTKRSSNLTTGQYIQEEPQKNQLPYSEFVKKNFHQVECRYYVAVGAKEPNKCKCGEYQKGIEGSKHRRDKPPFSDGPNWDQSKVMEKKITNSFGKIEFEGEGLTPRAATQYLRLCDLDVMKNVYDLIFKYWKIKPGTLCISVIGGAKNFRMRKKDKDVFTHGLIKAAQTTNALIITSGLNLGITQVVGDAVREGQSYLFDKKKHANPICCLGISPWGYVLKRAQLQNNNGKSVSYRVSSRLLPGQPVSLNPDHTHYLFVDEGRRNGFSGTKAGNFGAAFKRGLTEEHQISVVLLIVEGGYDVFEEASRSVREEVPIVICEGTGRVSDILGEVYRELSRKSSMNSTGNEGTELILSDAYRKTLTKKLKDKLGIDDNKAAIAVKDVETIMAQRHLITIFDIKGYDDLDRAILYSLIQKMKVRGNAAEDESKIYTQIGLCLTWNRVDIARDRIFINEVTLQSEEWSKLLFEAIANAKVDFLELFLSNGASVVEFLKPENLLRLYMTCPKRHLFTHTVVFFLKRQLVKLTDIEELMANMLGCQVTSKYEAFCTSTISSTDQSSRPSTGFSRAQPPITNELSEENTCKKIAHPFQELFLWALLLEKHDLAKFFWERCEQDVIFLALLATRLYRGLERSGMMQDTERLDCLKMWKNHFESLAIKVVEECHDIDTILAAELIEQEHWDWGGITCLDVAFRASDQKFISCIVCQNSINYRWRSGLQISFGLCLLYVFIPCLMMKQAGYIADTLHDHHQHEHSMLNSPKACLEDIDDENCHIEENMNGQSFKIVVNDEEENTSCCCGRCFCDCNKIIIFYRAPQTKFCVHLIIYFVFLVYFTYVVLYGIQRRTITAHEVIYLVYLGLMILDKIIEVSLFPSKSFRERGRDWVRFSNWNKFDVTLILLSTIAICQAIVRYSMMDNQTINFRYLFRSLKTFYGVIVGMFFLKCLRLLTLQPNLGPKMVMIAKMIQELMLYLLIIIIILLSYGVASQASYYTEVEFSSEHLFGIVNYPYFALFGDLNLENNIFRNFCNESSLSVTCPEQNFLIPMLYAVYIFIGNILLLNVLIAIFSFIFHEIHQNSIDIWKYSMFSLVQEYDQKTFLPIPFSIIIHLICLGQYIHESHNRRNVVDVAKPNDESQSSRSVVKSGMTQELSEDEEEHQTPHIKTNQTSQITECETIDPLYLQAMSLEDSCQRVVLAEIQKQKLKTMENSVNRVERSVFIVDKQIKNLTSTVEAIDSKVTKFEFNSLITQRTSTQGSSHESRHEKTFVSPTQSLSSTNSMDPISQVLHEIREWRAQQQSLIENIMNQTSQNAHKTRSVGRKLKELRKNTTETVSTIETMLEATRPSTTSSQQPRQGAAPVSQTEHQLDHITQSVRLNQDRIGVVEAKIDDLQQNILSSFRSFEALLSDKALK